MAFSFDTSLYFTGNANPLTTNYTCGANSKLLVLDIGTEIAAGAGGRVAGTPSFGGKLLYNVNASSGMGGESIIEMFALENPSVGSAYSLSIPNAGGITINCHLSSYKITAGSTIAFDGSSAVTYATATNPSTNIKSANAPLLVVAASGNGATNAMQACYPGNFITPILDKGACQNEAQWYIKPTTTDVSIGFLTNSSPGRSGTVVGWWREIAAAARVYGGILKFYNGTTWTECPSTKFKIWNGSSWICPSTNFKVYDGTSWNKIRMS